MTKRFRAWDGNAYWYSDENLSFIYDFKIETLQTTPFELKNIEQYIGKRDMNNVMMYENDLIINIAQPNDKIYRIIWSDNECGFRKVPQNVSYPETKIDSAFMKIIGTIHSK
jgi:hypothetical protein